VLVLNKLYLHPGHQGCGHGARIISRIIEMAHSCCKPVELSVLVTNRRARGFYERQGFAAVADGAQKISMRREP
jgi:ribosomal protein S18 acetylase RimI-like enzyme